MSTLTGNQIKDTYQGLLKLADSSTGITNSFQAIQDGLGNNTGVRIRENQLEAPNFPGFHALKGSYYGMNIGTTAPQQMASGLQNIILATPFYDPGVYSYSGAIYNVVTQTSTSDIVEFGIYTSQMLNPDGLFPHEPIITGLTADTATTGVKTITFPSNISMSGYGGGVYWIVFKVSNSGVQPTIRFGGIFQASNNPVLFASSIYGHCASVAGLPTLSTPLRTNGNFQIFSGQTTFDNPFPTDLNSKQSTVLGVNGTTLALSLLPV